jgi:NADH:ubiquinone oxidoreductase subunit 3 (subunit A)
MHNGDAVIVVVAIIIIVVVVVVIVVVVVVIAQYIIDPLGMRRALESSRVTVGIGELPIVRRIFEQGIESGMVANRTMSIHFKFGQSTSNNSTTNRRTKSSTNT